MNIYGYFTLKSFVCKERTARIRIIVFDSLIQKAPRLFIPMLSFLLLYKQLLECFQNQTTITGSRNTLRIGIGI
mgnify:CR=1 FL=1